MREFFNFDGPFNRYGGFVADMLILSLMWLLFSLPLITIGASTSAMFYVSTRRIADREGYITSDFWYAFKSNFKRATALWGLLFVAIFLLWFNIYNIDIVGGAIANFILPAQFVFLIVVVLITVYIFPMTARFDMSVWQTIKSSFFMAIRHVFTSVTCVVLFFALLIGSMIIPIIIFLAPGIYAICSSYLLMRVFKKYRPEMDKDPVLEIAEIEAAKAEARRRAEVGTFDEEELDNGN